MYRNGTRGTWALRSGSPALIALMACALLAGCGNLTAGGLTGEATVTVSGDAPDAQGTAPQRAVGLYPTPPFPAQHDVPEGEVRADFFVDLVAANGDEVSMSEDQISIRVDVQGRQELDVAVQTVPATLYTQIRIIFTDIRVEVESGLIINGVPVVGEVEVELEDVALVVTRPLNLDIGDGESVFLLIDLNANTWLQAVDPLLGVIMEEVFGDAVSVAVR